MTRIYPLKGAPLYLTGHIKVFYDSADVGLSMPRVLIAHGSGRIV